MVNKMSLPVSASRISFSCNVPVRSDLQGNKKCRCARGKAQRIDHGIAHGACNETREGRNYRECKVKERDVRAQCDTLILGVDRFDGFDAEGWKGKRITKAGEYGTDEGPGRRCRKENACLSDAGDRQRNERNLSAPY